MSLLTAAKARMEQADYVLAGLVEIQRGGSMSSTPAEFVHMIPGATIEKVRPRMKRLEQLGVIEPVADDEGFLAQDFDGQAVGYQLTIMGEALLLEELGGWTPDPSERARREAEMRRATGGIA